MAAVAWLALTCAACDGAPPAAAPDAGTLDGGAPAPHDCHDLPNTAAPVQSIQVAEPRPDGEGGPIVDGLYHRVANTIYTGAGGATGPFGDPIAETLDVRAGIVQHVSTTARGGNRTILGYTTDGASITLTFQCPDPDGSPPIFYYTATATSLTLLGWTAGVGPVLHYTLVEPW